jgi:hypothetical protein
MQNSVLQKFWNFRVQVQKFQHTWELKVKSETEDLDNKILILILSRLISDCSITSIDDIVFVFDHIQLKIIIAFDNLLQIKHYFSLNLKQVPNSSKKILIWLNI